MSSLREHIERSERSSTDLDGATVLPLENTLAANAGEWAARWNARPQWQREQWVARHNENALREVGCLEADHQKHIEYLQAENTRLTRLLADNHIAYLGAIGVRLSDLAA